MSCLLFHQNTLLFLRVHYAFFHPGFKTLSCLAHTQHPLCQPKSIIASLFFFQHSLKTRKKTRNLTNTQRSVVSSLLLRTTMTWMSEYLPRNKEKLFIFFQHDTLVKSIIASLFFSSTFSENKKKTKKFDKQKAFNLRQFYYCDLP